MRLKSILQLVFTSTLSQVLVVLNQLLVPPFFLRYYANGIEYYGEWIALSAAVSYLSTLNYGIQNYSANQVSILYNGGDVEGARSLQASAFRLLLMIALALLTLGLIVFLLPVAGGLNLHHVTNMQAAWTLYLLIAQFAVRIFYSTMTNSFMMVGKLHRGNYWNCAQTFVSIVATAIVVMRHGSFPMMALAQFAVMAFFALILMVDIRRTSAILLPSLKLGSWAQTVAIIKPCGHFGIFAIASFLVWQGPVLLMQLLLGSATVGMFALVRTVFQMSRMMLGTASYAVSQDITILVGKKDWKELYRLYDLSERVVLFLVPVITFGVLTLCPFLFTVWLHKHSFYDPQLCLLMAMISAVMGLKEHKNQFQLSSNRHETLAMRSMIGQVIMLGIAAALMPSTKLTGFLVLWLIWEVIQVLWTLGQNSELFPAEMPIPMKPVIKLCVMLAVFFAALGWPVYQEGSWPLWGVVGWSCLTMVVVGGVAYKLFGVGELRGMLMAKIGKKFGFAG